MSVGKMTDGGTGFLQNTLIRYTVFQNIEYGSCPRYSHHFPNVCHVDNCHAIPVSILKEGNKVALLKLGLHDSWDCNMIVCTECVVMVGIAKSTLACQCSIQASRRVDF